MPTNNSVIMPTNNSVIKLRERDLEQYAIDLLLLDNWRVFRTDANRYHHDGKSARHPLGEPGMPDLLCIRYGRRNNEVLWIEMKSRTGRLMPHQSTWIKYEKARGAWVAVCKQDFEPTPESFKAWYEAGGLCRRKLT